MIRIAIRKMLESDLTVISELSMLANPHFTKEKCFEFILDGLKRNPDLAFVAVDVGKIVGYVLADIRGYQGMLEDIVVAKEYQGKGLGRSLLKRILKSLKSRGAVVVLAEVHYKCAAAIPFYYKNGFRIIGFVQDYFGVGHDAIILKCNI
jgi:ribosomal-protein-alanine N-acetyltransferase